MFQYFAYGCSIRSDLALPELYPAETGDDIQVKLVSQLPQHQLPPRTLDAPYDLRASEREALLSLPGLAHFYASDGKQVLVEVEDGADLRAVQLNVVTAMLPFLLMQRGLLLLHGSAVSLNGRAFAFLGPSGAGKSSTAATLCAGGACLLVDDVIALTLSSDIPILCPGFPQLKLLAAMSDRLGGLGVAPQDIHPSEEKKALRVGDTYSPEMHELTAMYFLTVGEEASIRPLAASELMRSVSSNPYMNGLPPDPRRFKACARLAERVAGFELTRSKDVDDLPQFTEMLLRHISGQKQRA